MTESAYTAACEFCGLKLDIRKSGVYQHVSGWAMNREKGLHGVSLQERDRRWACRQCVEDRARGSFGQMAL